MKTTPKFISIILSVLMVITAFSATTSYAETAFTKPSLWFGEDFQNSTVGSAYVSADNDKIRNTDGSKSVVSQDSGDDNIYLTLKANDIRFGQPNSDAFKTYLTGRGGTNAWILEFDMRLKTLPSAESYPNMQLRYASTNMTQLNFKGNKLYWGSEEIAGITIAPMKWMHLTYMNDGTGLKIYFDNTLIFSNTTTDLVAKNIYLNASNHNFDVDNMKAYAFTNTSVATAIANADICRAVSSGVPSERIDAASEELINAENTAVENGTFAAADYTAYVTKVNDTITIYNTAVNKKIPSYAQFKNDEIFGAGVLELLAYFDAESEGTVSELISAVEAFEAIFKRTVNITEFTVCDNAASIKGSVIPAKETALNITVAPDTAGTINADILSGSDGKFSYDFTLNTPELTGNYTVGVTSTEADGIPFDTSSQNSRVFELKNAADRAQALAFSAYTTANLSAFETELKTTDNFFYCLDMAADSDYDKLVNKNYVLEKLLENKPYSTVTDLKNEFTYHITMQRLRETTEPLEIARMLDNYYNTLTGDTLTEEFQTYKLQICELLAANISVVTDEVKLEEFIKTAQIYYQIINATITTVADTLDGFVNNDESYAILVKHGLDENYKTVDSSVQIAAAKAIPTAELSITNSFNLAEEMGKLTTAVNAVVNAPVEEPEEEDEGESTPSYTPSDRGGIGKVTISKPLEKEEETAINPQPITPLEPENKNYADVCPKHWAAEAIYTVRDKGIMTGDGNGNFFPDEYIKREEMAKIIIEAFDITSDGEKSNFNDVAENMWYSKYIDIAVSKGLILGESENEFGISKAMTRQDVAVVIYRYLSNKENNFEKVEVNTYADDAEIAPYAKDAVKFMQQHNLMVGSDGRFNPRQPLTRAMAAKIICNIMAE